MHPAPTQPTGMSRSPARSQRTGARGLTSGCVARGQARTRARASSGGLTAHVPPTASRLGSGIDLTGIWTVIAGSGGGLTGGRRNTSPGFTCAPAPITQSALMRQAAPITQDALVEWAALIETLMNGRIGSTGLIITAMVKKWSALV